METKDVSSLWPDFDFGAIKTPIAILQEQANELGKKAKHVILGEIITTEAYEEKTGEMALIYQFYVKAPVLSNYRFLLFRLVQRSSLYPVDIYFEPGKQKIENVQENEFTERLRDILNNEKTKEIVQNLYAQSVQIKGSHGE